MRAGPGIAAGSPLPSPPSLRSPQDVRVFLPCVCDAAVRSIPDCAHETRAAARCWKSLETSPWDRFSASYLNTSTRRTAVLTSPAESIVNLPQYDKNTPQTGKNADRPASGITKASARITKSCTGITKAHPRITKSRACITKVHAGITEVHAGITETCSCITKSCE